MTSVRVACLLVFVGACNRTAPPGSQSLPDEDTTTARSESQASIDPPETRTSESRDAETRAEPVETEKEAVISKFPEFAKPALAWLQRATGEVKPFEVFRLEQASERLPLALLPRGIAADGVVIQDVDTPGETHCQSASFGKPHPPSTVDACLARIMHMLYTFRDAIEPSNNAADVLVEKSDEGFVLRIVPGWYNLYFEGKGAKARLRRVEYLTSEEH